MSESRTRLSHWSNRFDAPYVAFSGGKDSTVLLDLALQFWDVGLVVWHWDYGPWLVPRPYAREIIHNAEDIISGSKAELHVYHRPGGKDARDDCSLGYRAFFATLRKMSQDLERDCGLTGMRASESKGRAIRSKNYEERDSATKLPLLYPLRDWTAGDCWAYIVSNEIPYHSVYDDYATMKGGYDSEKNRFVTFFDSEMERFGSPFVDGILSWRFRNDTK